MSGKGNVTWNTKPIKGGGGGVLMITQIKTKQAAKSYGKR